MIFLWLLITDDTPATTPLMLSNHRNDEEVNNKEDSFADGFEVVSLPFSRPIKSNDEKDTPSDDKERLLNTIVEVIGLIVWEEAIDVIVTDEMYLKHVRTIYGNYFIFSLVYSILGLVSSVYCSKRFY